jgi:DNA-binding MarR family transcriptional regulator
MLAVPAAAKAARQPSASAGAAGVASAKPAAKPAANSERWVASALLRALATLAPCAGQRFTGPALAASLPDLPARRRANGTRRLVALGFVTHARSLVDGRPVYTYTVTPEGAAAIAAAASGAVLMAGRQGTLAARPGTLRARLWALLRMRRVLDAETAARLLCDAGDSSFVSKRNRINEFMRRWRDAGVVDLSAAIGPRGQKRYVLLADSGPAVPAFKPRGHRQEGRA